VSSRSDSAGSLQVLKMNSLLIKLGEEIEDVDEGQQQVSQQG
jgi:hypothetical protein